MLLRLRRRFASGLIRGEGGGGGIAIRGERTGMRASWTSEEYGTNGKESARAGRG